MKNKRVLAIDDCRELSFANVLCRTYNDGLMALENMGPWSELYLDHDLGAIDSQYTETGRELTGMDILNWLEEHPEYLPDEITIVSGNASRLEMMEMIVERLYKK